LGTSVSFTNKTDCSDIEILLKVALSPYVLLLDKTANILCVLKVYKGSINWKIVSVLALCAGLWVRASIGSNQRLYNWYLLLLL
jgi:hypothetical protein